jgi:hypothetical protein
MSTRSTRTGRGKFLCLDCGIDTSRIGEFYFVQTETWISVVGSKNGMLCIGCLERRLGRLLKQSDFTDAYINRRDWGSKSARFLNRLSLA